jgi:oligopeptide transport system substrate-binding protein
MLAVAAAALGGCGEDRGGPLRIIAVGPPPALTNPNRDPLTPAAAMLLASVAQGLVRFDAAGEIEPALAQSWIVSDDGRRYTFRLRRALWARGEPVTAPQVAARLQAAISRPSRNALKPVLGVIEEVEAMTDHVLEIRIRSPRPHFLQLLAQPELAILQNGEGTGPYRMGGSVEEWLRLVPPPADEEEGPGLAPDLHLTGRDGAAALAGFAAGEADFVTGGTIAEAPLLNAADLPEAQTLVDPVQGLLGLAFVNADGLLAEPRVRQALAMAINREEIASRFPGMRLQARASLLPAGIAEVQAPAAPDWAAAGMPARREAAARLLREAAAAAEQPPQPLRLRVAMPDGFGYRILFAHLRRDWRAIGVEAERVAISAPADLRFIDAAAPANLASWYLRSFACGQWPVCDEQAAFFTEAARSATNARDRTQMLMQADRALTDSGIYIAIANPVRWSLRSPRLDGLRANRFGRHDPTELIESRN